jgi:L-histidine N-alpha-methyltransferase
MPRSFVAIHSSQLPQNVRRDLLESLRTRRVNHKFLYDGPNKSQKWLALHEAHSPARTDPDCLAIYDKAFAATALRIAAPAVHLIGLGCGGGQKDTRLLELLKFAGKRLAYIPADVSVNLARTAHDAALAVIEARDCHPFSCDLATADDLAGVLDKKISPDAARLITFFGMIPNFEPRLILARLAALIRPDDYLLFSANLAPGDDYLDGIRRVLPLYDNALTRDWLVTFLTDLGIEKNDGDLRFTIEEDPDGLDLKRIAAHFHFTRTCQATVPAEIVPDVEVGHFLTVKAETFPFQEGESIRLFFSYRHTPEKIRSLLAAHKISVLDSWTTRSGEEGVFLCRRIC